MTLAFVFPGQGSQAVGMGQGLAESFPEARAVFDEVDAALGQKLSALNSTLVQNFIRALMVERHLLVH